MVIQIYKKRIYTLSLTRDQVVKEPGQQSVASLTKPLKGPLIWTFFQRYIKSWLRTNDFCCGDDTGNLVTAVVLARAAHYALCNHSVLESS